MQEWTTRSNQVKDRWVLLAFRGDLTACQSMTSPLSGGPNMILVGDQTYERIVSPLKIAQF